MEQKPPAAPKYVQLATVKKREVIFNSFLGGLAWGVGSVIGATIIIALIGLIISRSQNVPFLGEITEAILEQIEEGREAFNEQFREDMGANGSTSYPTSYTTPQSNTAE